MSANRDKKLSLQLTLKAKLLCSQLLADDANGVNAMENDPKASITIISATVPHKHQGSNLENLELKF